MKIGRLHISKISRRWGHTRRRFGGGWRWLLGLQIGGDTLIVNLLVVGFRFDWKAD